MDGSLADNLKKTTKDALAVLEKECDEKFSEVYENFVKNFIGESTRAARHGVAFVQVHVPGWHHFFDFPILSIYGMTLTEHLLSTLKKDPKLKNIEMSLTKSQVHIIFEW